jgi:hypothetical protein
MLQKALLFLFAFALSYSSFSQTRHLKIPWEDKDVKKIAVSIRPDGVKQAWLQDPDGYWVEINDAKD